MRISDNVLGNKQKKGKTLKNQITILGLASLVTIGSGCAAPMVKTQKDVFYKKDSCGNVVLRDLSYEERPRGAVSGLYPPPTVIVQQTSGFSHVPNHSEYYRQPRGYSVAYGANVHPGGNPWAAAEATEAARSQHGGRSPGWWLEGNVSSGHYHQSHYPIIQTPAYEQPREWRDTREKYFGGGDRGHRGRNHGSQHLPGQPPPRSGHQPRTR